MRTAKAFCTILVVSAALISGCESNKKKSATGNDSPAMTASASQPKSGKQTRVVFTSGNNPTSLAQRGEPSLEDQQRPAVWMFIDGQAGKYTEVDGNRHLEWVIDAPVGTEPTIRVEAYEPLLGQPRDFKFVLQSIETADGSKVSYSAAAEPGAFEIGREYSLLDPGQNFQIQNLLTRDSVKRIPPLPVGRYLIAGGLKNIKTGAETAAVSTFTVRE